MSDIIDHKERAHSKVGASVAERFFACPGCLVLSDGIPDETSIYAAEGTAAHELSEKCLRSGQDAAEFVGETLVVGNHTFEVDDEFAEHVQVYLDTVRGECADEGDVLTVEERFDLTPFLPEATRLIRDDLGEVVGVATKDVAFGTSDAVILKRRRKRLVVIDLKFGKGYAVEVKGNKQGRYYGLGALLNGNFSVDEVEIVIVQPRAAHPDGPVRREVIPVMDLLEFKYDLTVAILATMQPGAPRNAGPWCKFCPAAGICPERRQKSVTDARAEFAEAPTELEGDELVGILAEAKQIEDWIKAVRKEAYMRLCGGGKVGDYKLVAKRATRKWVSDESIVALAISDDLSVDESLLWDRKLRSPAQVEKLLPRGTKKALEPYFVKASSGYTIAPGSDKRQAVDPSATATSDFAEEPDDD